MRRMFFLIFLIVLLAGCQPFSYERQVGEEKISDTAEINMLKVTTFNLANGKISKYNYEMQKISYQFDGKTIKAIFYPEMRPALEWIKGNTPEDAVIMSWWDYGHTIQGYTERGVVIYSPSKDILFTLANQDWNENKEGTFSPNEKILDVATALTTEDVEEMKTIVDKHSADYILTHASDAGKSTAIFYILGQDSTGYYYFDTRTLREGFTDKASGIMLYKMWNKQDIDGFELVYSDDFVKIYGVSKE